MLLGAVFKVGVMGMWENTLAHWHEMRSLTCLVTFSSRIEGTGELAGSHPPAKQSNIGKTPLGATGLVRLETKTIWQVPACFFHTGVNK